MPYEPIRCPTCASTKTIVSENGRFFCISCEGWFAWTASNQTAVEQKPHPTQSSIEAMQRELHQLRELVKQLQQTPPSQPRPIQQPSAKPEGNKQAAESYPLRELGLKPIKFSDAEIARQNMQKWFYQTSEGIQGPTSFKEILRLHEQRAISRQTPISNDKAKWTTLTDIALGRPLDDAVIQIIAGVLVFLFLLVVLWIVIAT